MQSNNYLMKIVFSTKQHNGLMGNKVCTLCVTIKSKRKVYKLSVTINGKRKVTNPANSSTTTTTVPSSTCLFQENLLESDNAAPPPFICQICFESKPLSDSFNVEGCNHFYCTNCTLKYIVSKLQDNVLNLVCPEPGCFGVLNPHHCKPILPKNVSMQWENALSESMIPENVKFYCPFNDCSALLINDDNNGEVIRESTCPHCKRSICVQCKVPWHQEFSCEKFQNMKGMDDDLMLDLAKRRNWKQCPMCKNYVEKKDGCNHIKCRCGHEFCYQCGYSSIYHHLH